MKTRLLKKLRREAKRNVKIAIDDNGRFIIMDTSWCLKSYFYENKIDVWRFGDYVNHFNTIDEAIEKLSLARRIYILDKIICIKKTKDIQHKRKLIKRL